MLVNGHFVGCHLSLFYFEKFHSLDAGFVFRAPISSKEKFKEDTHLRRLSYLCI